MMSKETELLRLASDVAAQEKKEYAQKRSQGGDFNVFYLCKVDHYENMHSYIIANLLNPKGSHGQGALFLDLFLSSLDKSFVTSFESAKASVYTEYSTEWGRMDIVIEDNNGMAVIIENKVYAADQDSQLRRYDSFARSNRYKPDGYRILYLTLDGHEAEDHSGKDVHYTCISYQETILSWLEQCLSTVLEKPALREPLIQYIKLIKQLVGKEMNNPVNQNLLKEMLSVPDGVAAIVRAYPQWEKSIIENHVFNKLKSFSEAEGFEFVISNNFWSKDSWVYFVFRFDSAHAIMFQFEKFGWKQCYYGLLNSNLRQKAPSPLPGLYGGNDGWPYGWHYLDIHKNWTVDDLVEISHDEGEFVQYIVRVVNTLKAEMHRSGII